MSASVEVDVASFEWKSIESMERWMHFATFACLYLQTIFGPKQNCEEWLVVCENKITIKWKRAERAMVKYLKLQ
jgi:hypothetical protein